ncbi:hypothetical protein [Flavobacterium sp. PS2]|uniref:hypothetical protein n=1 Tax=Flavobacterium sp. PS2 TaxID=3384157 RepID=UPI00390CCED4
MEFYPDSWKKSWDIYVYPQEKQFYTIVYKYDYTKYTLRKKYKIFGWDSFLRQKLKIGFSYEYDEQRNLIKETDEDKKFGKFGYNELLRFLDKEKKINLRKGLEGDINRDDKMDIGFYYSDTSNKKSWDVFVHIGLAQGEITPPWEIGERASQPGKGYFIDGNTGEVIKRSKETIEYYKEIGFN